jgi:hypothetical protein
VRSIAKVLSLLGISALLVAVPALAKKPPHPAHPAHPSHPGSKSHKCTVHKVAYVASGTVVSWSATQNSDGTWSGQIQVAVKRANHHGKAAKGTNVTYTLSSAKVHFAKGTTNPPSAPDSVKLIGKITAIAKKCSDQTGAGVITIRKVDVRAAKTAG